MGTTLKSNISPVAEIKIVIGIKVLIFREDLINKLDRPYTVRGI